MLKMTSTVFESDRIERINSFSTAREQHNHDMYSQCYSVWQ